MSEPSVTPGPATAGVALTGRGALVTGAASGIKRLIEPTEVAEFCAFLCTPEASYINGASLTMDGGWTAR